MQPNTKALIIEAYGSGNLPNIDQVLIHQIDRIIASDCHVIITSQCPQATVTLGTYFVSELLNHEKIINAKNMTFEACIAKTYYLLSQNISRDKFKRLFLENIVGELE